MRALWLSVSGLALLSACAKVPEKNTPEPVVVTSAASTQDDNTQKDESVSDWKDDDTGCHYLIWNGNMTPKLDVTGKPVCD